MLLPNQKRQCAALWSKAGSSKGKFSTQQLTPVTALFVENFPPQNISNGGTGGEGVIEGSLVFV